jgi:predicted RND superfamily exporter protein
MMQRLLIDKAIKYPRTIIGLGIAITLIFLAAFPSLETDTDPVHMLPADNPAVTLYNGIKAEFHLNDMVALGIKSKDGSSLFTRDRLTRIHKITGEILKIRDVKRRGGLFSKIMNKLAFLRDKKEERTGGGDNELFVGQDVVSVSTVDDITRNAAGELMVVPLMEKPPANDEEAARILQRLNQNPMLAGKMASTDGSLLGIFIPMKQGKKERSFYLGEEIKKIAGKYLGTNEQFYFAGLPIAESTFGNEMFVQMGVYAPLAGLVIFLLMLYFFRSIKLVAAPMLLGIMVVIWSMGALIYSGNVIHIMSSMIPIFLLPIAVLNSVHILSKLGDRIADYPSKEEAIRSVMKELFNPMLYTSLTTIVGFVSLSTTGIPPVIVFGVTIGFGVFMSWLMSMLFIPAYTMLLSDKALAGFSRKERKSLVVEVVQFFRKVSDRKAGAVLAVSAILLVVSAVGLSLIVVNDNPVRWFKEGHSIREADTAMNEKLAGTYMANLYFSLDAPGTLAKKTPTAGGDDFTDDFADADDESAVPAPSVRDPRVIRYIENVGRFLKTVKQADGTPAVGGVTSIADVLRKVGKEALGDPALPETREKISQYIFLFESGDLKKGKDLWKIITPGESRSSQMWVYFKNGDNQLMTYVMDKLHGFMAKNPPPVLEGADGQKLPLNIKWSGLMHINNVWQGAMVSGMARALFGSFIIVFLMMVFLFRSFRWAVIAMLPLSITIAFIYGAIGFSGKFYDMPIAVLSSLTLGLSIDFAIHFIEHVRVFNQKLNNKTATLAQMFKGTAQAIWRNVLVISIGFCPLFFAGLVPYVTVGSFFFAIMLVSGIVTLVLMPAIINTFGPFLPGFSTPEPVKVKVTDN